MGPGIQISDDDCQDRTGYVLEMHEEDGRIVASKVTEIDPLQRVTGILELDRSTDDWIDELRGEPDAT